MNSVITKYIKASSVSFIGKMVSVGSGLGVVYLLTQILDKAAFGGFMWALSIVLLVAMVLSRFFQSLIVYHGARGTPDKAIAPLSLGWGLILGVGIAWGLSFNRSLPFLSELAWVVPCYMATFIIGAHHRARQEIGAMVMVQEIGPAVLKLLVLGGIWLAGLPIKWIGIGFALSYLLPFVGMMIRAPVWPRFWAGGADWWDLRYGFMAGLSQLMNKSTRNLLTVFLGFMVSASVLADVAIAMRLAQFLLLPHLMLSQLHVPRIGERLRQDDKAGLMQEFRVVQSLSLLATLLGSLAFVVLGGFMLGVFGEYESAYPLLLLLCGASIIRAGFGDVGGFIVMVGRMGAGLIVNSASLAVMVLGLAAFVPFSDLLGTGFALLLAAMSGSAGLAFALYRYEGFQVMTWLMALVIVGSVLPLLILAVAHGGL